MRTSVSFAFALLACTTTKPPGSTTTDPGDPAPVGVPAGAAVTRTIGAAGGTVASGDGGLSIIVPPGAVTSDTMFSIQPITNTSFAPVGSGYRLAPTVSFASPVTLQFAYTDAELANSSPEAMTIAGQDAVGYWVGHRAATLDTTAHTLSLDVTSFVEESAGPETARLPAAPADADWTLTYTVRVFPTESTVALGGTKPLNVWQCFKLDENGGLASETEVQKKCVDIPDAARVEWTVDDNTAGGRAGSIAGNGDVATYTAPAKLYDPVYVTARVSYKNRGLGYAANIHLVCPAKRLAPGAADVCLPESWTGTSHIAAPDGAVYDSNFTFAIDPAQPDHFLVQSGQVNITKQPMFSGDCTTTIDASHPIAPHDGSMTIDETDLDNPIISGEGGTTVWLATYTQVCPNGTTTMMLPYSAAWWPTPTGGAPSVTAQHAMATITVDGLGGTGTVTIARNP